MNVLRAWLERLGKWTLPAAALAVAVIIEIALAVYYALSESAREDGLTWAPLFWAAFGFAAVWGAAALARLAVHAGLIRERDYYADGAAREESDE